tara:strand:- start:3 stop:209 length:207 start_codon:yes stop_codon:yes gene_type:complete
MNEDNLNMEIRKFLKKVGIASQRFIENELIKAESDGNLKPGQRIELEMTLSIKSLGAENKIIGEIDTD